MFEIIFSMVIGQKLNPLRQSIGLSPTREIFKWWLSPDLVIALFPDWYAQKQTDWPAQLRLCGFPIQDGNGQEQLPSETVTFCEKGSKPIVFTFGTGMMHAHTLFKEAIEVCSQIQERAIFLTRFPEQLPTELPPFVHYCRFAPLQKLLPLCSAIVHHGGIGTTAKAFASGIPQLILPFAFDQLDNACRVKKAGAGEFLLKAQRNPSSVTAALTRILDEKCIFAAQAVGKRFDNQSGIESAASMIQEFSQKKR
ncbi:MAG: glycosyltransferase [Verrucomicrobiota bacterium]|nr:glycosyltransferase [Verrucomicrobiota bacterium]